MSNEFEFFQPVAVVNAVHAYAERLEQLLASLKRPDLLAPEAADYRVTRRRGSALAVEVDLHIAPGAHLKIVAPFSSERDDLRRGVEKLGDRLTTVLADLDERLALRAEVELEARARLKRLARSGIRGRVLDVRLSPIDLTSSYGVGRIEVLVEGEAC